MATTRTTPKLLRACRMMTVLATIAVAALLAGCATYPSTRYGGGPGPGGGYYGNNSTRCYQGCGYVRDISQVDLGGGGNHAALGTVIGALIGGAVGHQVGGGKGKTAATVAGAVAGGYAGHEIGERSDNDRYGWRIGVELGNGQYATVTQRDPPHANVGDYVFIRNDHVYRY